TLMEGDASRKEHLSTTSPSSDAVPVAGASAVEAQVEHERAPLVLKAPHVGVAEHGHERLVARRVGAPRPPRRMKELAQEAVLLQVVHQVAGLGVVGARILVVKRAIAGAGELAKA